VGNDAVDGRAVPVGDLPIRARVGQVEFQFTAGELPSGGQPPLVGVADQVDLCRWGLTAPDDVSGGECCWAEKCPVATRPTCPSPWKQEVRSRPISAARVDRDSTIKDRGRADMVSDCANTRSRTWTTNRPTPCVSRTKAQFRADSVGNRGKFFLGVSLVGAHAPTSKGPRTPGPCQARSCLRVCTAKKVKTAAAPSADSSMTVCMPGSVTCPDSPAVEARRDPRPNCRVPNSAEPGPATRGGCPSSARVVALGVTRPVKIIITNSAQVTDTRPAVPERSNATRARIVPKEPVRPRIRRRWISTRPTRAALSWLPRIMPRVVTANTRLNCCAVASNCDCDTNENVEM